MFDHLSCKHGGRVLSVPASAWAPTSAHSCDATTAHDGEYLFTIGHNHVEVLPSSMSTCIVRACVLVRPGGWYLSDTTAHISDVLSYLYLEHEEKRTSLPWPAPRKIITRQMSTTHKRAVKPRLFTQLYGRAQGPCEIPRKWLPK